MAPSSKWFSLKFRSKWMKNQINCANELTCAEYSNETSFHAPRSVLIDGHLWLIGRHTNDEIISARFGRCHGDARLFGEKMAVNLTQNWNDFWAEGEWKTDTLDETMWNDRKLEIVFSLLCIIIIFVNFVEIKERGRLRQPKTLAIVLLFFSSPTFPFSLNFLDANRSTRQHANEWNRTAAAMFVVGARVDLPLWLLAFRSDFLEKVWTKLSSFVFKELCNSNFWGKGRSDRVLSWKFTKIDRGSWRLFSSIAAVFVIFRPNTWFYWIKLKRLFIERKMGYRMMCRLMKFDWKQSSYF